MNRPAIRPHYRCYRSLCLTNCVYTQLKSIHCKHSPKHIPKHIWRINSNTSKSKNRFPSRMLCEVRFRPRRIRTSLKLFFPLLWTVRFSNRTLSWHTLSKWPQFFLVFLKKLNDLQRVASCTKGKRSQFRESLSGDYRWWTMRTHSCDSESGLPIYLTSRNRSSRNSIIWSARYTTT